MSSATRVWWIGLVSSLASIALLLSPSVGPSRAAAVLGYQGLQDGWPVGDNGQTTVGQLLSDELGIMEEAGAGWVRVNFRLGQCFQDWTSRGCNGRTALATYDEVLKNAQAKGLRVLGLISNESWHGDQSQWTANNAENVQGGTGDNGYIRAFAQNAGLLAGHFDGTNGPLVSQWEVWNEPNAWTFNPAPGVYTGSSFIYPSNFAQLLSRSHRAIKAAQLAGGGSPVVISGGLLALDSAGPLALNSVGLPALDSDGPRMRRSNGYHSGLASADYSALAATVPSGGDYLAATYDMGWKHGGWIEGAAPFDQVGQHLYLDQGGTTSSSKISQYVGDLRTVYTGYGEDPSSKPMQITEFGWSTGSVSPEVQANNLRIAYQTLGPPNTPYMARAYWYRTQDLGVTGDFYGLYDTEGEPKPSYRAYQRHAAQ